MLSLRELKGLLDDGILTDEEFQVQKEETLRLANPDTESGKREAASTNTDGQNSIEPGKEGAAADDEDEESGSSTQKMYRDSHPPTAFSHSQWVELRDTLFQTKQHTHSDNRCLILYEIAVSMNQLQDAYGECIATVGDHGRLIAESVAELLKIQEFPVSSTLGTQITLLQREGVDIRVLKDLNLINSTSTRVDQQNTKPADKPVVADSVYALASHVLKTAQSGGWLPEKPPATLTDRLVVLERSLGLRAGRHEPLESRIQKLEQEQSKGNQQSLQSMLTNRIGYLEFKAGIGGGLNQGLGLQGLGLNGLPPISVGTKFSNHCTTLQHAGALI
jgi:hypothetical protein